MNYHLLKFKTQDMKKQQNKILKILLHLKANVVCFRNVLFV
jgi:hypothetical protein